MKEIIVKYLKKANKDKNYDLKNKLFIDLLKAGCTPIYLTDADGDYDNFYDLICIPDIGVIPVPVLQELLGVEEYRALTSGIDWDFRMEAEEYDEYMDDQIEFKFTAWCKIYARDASYNSHTVKKQWKNVNSQARYYLRTFPDKVRPLHNLMEYYKWAFEEFKRDYKWYEDRIPS